MLVRRCERIACTASTTDDPATPNPCVSLRETLVMHGIAHINGGHGEAVLARGFESWFFGIA